ncbi:unnamed protein product [Ilex paraguariensis]|uniref:Uncharacterized protein n=1 Tax=Ilex paraguariensis TaxID=185542 RepID=A0ABC8QUI4_9AQUA
MGRSPCCDKNGIKKGPWTPEEDLKLIQYIQMHGSGNWRTLPKNAGLQRCGKSCRLRWTNYLRPDIKRGRFSFEEEETIIQLHSVLGNKWSAIAARLPGRTDNEIKNFWNTHVRKRLLRMGIDPVTHSPRLDLLDLSSILNSTQLNLSNLLGLQALVNPELMRLTALLASNHENPDFLLHKLQENQLCNQENLLQNQSQMFRAQQLQALSQDVPICNPSSVPCNSFLNPTQLMQEKMGQLSTNSMNLSCQNFQENLASSNFTETLVTQPNYGFCGSDQIRNDDAPENSPLPSLNNSSSSNNSRNFSFESIISTPVSSPTPLNSSSTFINNSSTEDEMESYCSNLLKFEIPESFEFDDFM